MALVLLIVGSIYAVALVFALALCKAAARGDEWTATEGYRLMLEGRWLDRTHHTVLGTIRPNYARR